jgi:hypothetical protein
MYNLYPQCSYAYNRTVMLMLCGGDFRLMQNVNGIE